MPPEYAFTQVRNSDYTFLPGCIEHRVIERSPFLHSTPHCIPLTSHSCPTHPPTLHALPTPAHPPNLPQVPFLQRSGTHTHAITPWRTPPSLPPYSSPHSTSLVHLANPSIHRYNFDNAVTLIRIRTPSLQGRNVEYCKFVSCYANFVKRVYVIAFRGVKHDQVQYSEGLYIRFLFLSVWLVIS